MCQLLKPSEEIRALRNALGQFPTGVAIVTAVADNGRPVGMTINSFNSISMTPALVSWSIDRSSASYQAFAKTESFAITVLAEDQADLAKRFATRGVNKFQGIACDRTEAPIIPNGCAWFKCETYRSVLLGDHRMLVGKVIDFEKHIKHPLVFANGQFQRLAQTITETAQAAA